MFGGKPIDYCKAISCGFLDFVKSHSLKHCNSNVHCSYMLQEDVKVGFCSIVTPSTMISAPPIICAKQCSLQYCEDTIQQR